MGHLMLGVLIGAVVMYCFIGIYSFGEIITLLEQIKAKLEVNDGRA